MLRKLVNYSRARLRKFILEEFWYEDLVKMGMKVGDNCSLQPGITFDYSHCWLIKIGNNVTIAPQAYLLAHDASTKPINNYTKISGITIEDHVFIGARALIMPGVIIGKNSIIAAGSVVTKSIPENSVAAGNPAKVIAALDAYTEKINSHFHSSFSKVYDQNYTLSGNISRVQREKMYEEVKNNIGFVK